MKKVSILILISVCIIAFGTLFYSNQMAQDDNGTQLGPTPDTSPTVPQETQKEPDPSAIKIYPANQTKFTGVLRKVDMLQEQAAKRQLSSPVYIVDTEPFIVGSGNSANFLYLKELQVPADLSLDTMEGKCVEVDGTLDPESMNTDQMYYGESLLGGFVLGQPTIQTVNVQDCVKVISTQSKPEKFETIELTGVIKRINRPSADINYDYVIDTTEPIPGAQDMSGTGRPITSTVILPSNFEAYKSVEETLGTTVKIKGYLQWGYAESQFFTVEELVAQ